MRSVWINLAPICMSLYSYQLVKEVLYGGLLYQQRPSTIWLYAVIGYTLLKVTINACSWVDTLREYILLYIRHAMTFNACSGVDTLGEYTLLYIRHAKLLVVRSMCTVIVLVMKLQA